MKSLLKNLLSRVLNRIVELVLLLPGEHGWLESQAPLNEPQKTQEHQKLSSTHGIRWPRHNR